MGLFAKFKAGLQKTHGKLVHEIKRIVSRSPKLDAAALDELEAALIAADLGLAVTAQIVAAVKHGYESQGGAGLDVFSVARSEVEKNLVTNKSDLIKAANGPTVVSIVGVNGTGKTTTAAKLAHLIQTQK
jgi:fused signal recognition particle receptor